jgi:hypothetical protein
VAAAVLDEKLPGLLATIILLLQVICRMVDRTTLEDEIGHEGESKAVAEMDASDGYVAPPRYGPNPFATVDENVIESQRLSKLSPLESYPQLNLRQSYLKDVRLLQ